MKEICRIESELTTLSKAVVHVVVKKNIVAQQLSSDPIQEYFTACGRKLLSINNYIETRRETDCKVCQRIIKKHKREQDVPTVYTVVADDGQHFIGADRERIQHVLIETYGEKAVIKMFETKGALKCFKGKEIKLKPVIQITKSLVALNEV